jgi:hypothetical protein
MSQTIQQLENQLEREALAAYTRGMTWPEFYAAHLREMRQAEKYPSKKYYKLTFRLENIVCYGIPSRRGRRKGDSELIAKPWVVDGQPSPHDTLTQARLQSQPRYNPPDFK